METARYDLGKLQTTVYLGYGLSSEKEPFRTPDQQPGTDLHDIRASTSLGVFKWKWNTRLFTEGFAAISILAF